MDYDDIVTGIDQLHGNAIKVFGADSQTAAAFTKLYALACKEAKAFEEDTAPSDTEEYRAAHAVTQAADARAIKGTL